jgi:tetraacyldisaccharide-1-P 4'-kinase
VRRAGTRRFPDHHPYLPRDLEAVGAEARRCGAEILVTTEKDLVRVAAAPDGGPALFALVLGVSFASGSDITGFLLDRLRDRAPQARGSLCP